MGVLNSCAARLINSSLSSSLVKLLSLEDDEEDFEFINDTLKQSGLLFVIKRVHTKADYVNALIEYNPDVILSDHSLPLFDSVEALQLCVSNGVAIPFILVTGAVADQFAAKCRETGAGE